MIRVHRGPVSEWSQVSLDETVLFEPECGPWWLTDLGSERWIADVEHRNLFVLNSQGKTLRDVPGSEPRR